MRTTLDLPDELLKQAKIAAVERDMSLKEFVGQALAHELGLSVPAPGQRAQFPIFPSRSPGALRLTDAEIRRLEDAEDARRHGLST